MNFSSVMTVLQSSLRKFLLYIFTCINFFKANVPMKKIVTSYEDFKVLEGQMIGKSSEFLVSQKHISDFIESTNTMREGVFVPEFLLISLTPYLWSDIIQVRNTKMIINYGLPEVRFFEKVTAGESIRLIVWITQVNRKLGITKVEIKFSIEICERNIICAGGQAVFLYYFDDIDKIN